MGMLTVARPGLLSTLQDLGRHGSAHLGIGHSGAADLPALTLANALVGNPPGACALEVTLDGPTLTTDCDTWVAWAGAPLPQARLDDAPLLGWSSVHMPAGSRLELGGMPTGCRGYLAVAGGVDLPSWRGSRSTDVNAALGPIPRPLEKGDTLSIGRPGTDLPGAGGWSLDPRPWFDAHTSQPIRLLPGSHGHLLDADSRQALTQSPFTVANDSNRVGLRLQGQQLALSSALELVSAGVAAGTMQLPPNGQPIILGPEHPVTGGYPRIAQVATVDLPRLAQCRPGDTLRFEWIEPDQAMALLIRREAMLTQLGQHIRQRLERT